MTPFTLIGEALIRRYPGYQQFAALYRRNTREFIRIGNRYLPVLTDGTTPDRKISVLERSYDA